ncbi:MAG: hypothetical protein HGA96_05135 [Desulfobulbaceae bacterium]|nr:hypothetical protein [Desulfobulbaceae bacterium]
MLVQITDWRNYYQDGEKFLRTATAGQSRRPEIFTPEILYNVITMAIEKFIMGFLMYHGDLADNHTMADMIHSLERHLQLPASLTHDLLHLDSFQEICDLDNYNCKAPTRHQIDGMLATARETQRFIASRIAL